MGSLLFLFGAANFVSVVAQVQASAD